MRWSLPPSAAKFISAYVGRRPPSHAQNAKARNQLTSLIGRRSFAPGVSVHVAFERASDARSAVRSAGKSVFHPELQPEPASFGFAPTPAAGGAACVAPPAVTNARMRPTVTSNLSRWKGEIVAAPPTELRRLNVPPGTGAVSQQLVTPGAA